MNLKVATALGLIITVIILTVFITFTQKGSPELIVPEVKTTAGGAVTLLSAKEAGYFYPEDRSYITISPSIKQKQRVKRYLKVDGRVRLDKLPFAAEQFRTVIFELQRRGYKGGKDPVKRYYLTLPLDEKGKFSGYLYFKEAATYRVSLYLFYDYLSHFGIERKGGHHAGTTASLGFEVEAAEGVPEELHFLLPSENIDCGNRALRRLSRRVTKGLESDLERARAVYEYLVFYREKRGGEVVSAYKEGRSPFRKSNYSTTYIASQVPGSSEILCNDFAELYAAMMRSLGYHVKVISGFSDSEKSVGHQWNLVDLAGDGQSWLKVDSIWGHQDRANYKKWAELYPEFDDNFFETAYPPYNHQSFKFYRRVEY